MKRKQAAVVISQLETAPMIYDMWIESDLAAEALPGQFLCLYPKDKSTLLPRPISICEVNGDKTALRIVYRVAGQGTAEFARYTAGDSVELLGTLGNGFPVNQAKGKSVLLMGGGIGIPPMLQLAKALNEVTAKEKIRILVGYRDNRTFLREDLERYGQVWIATEDGSVGTRGNVLDAVQEAFSKGDASVTKKSGACPADLIYACGPMPMLRAVKRYGEEQGIRAYISLEEHMACGVGACLGCVVKTREEDAHSHVHNARICTDGPVFEAGEVDI
ncbi:MAG: dihydroorotate dehydrogenase electron transfer subunit [Muribaculum sp.]|nr:dihydroorotate dehydrogenase electron transfer subunit [Muribaculum sp.]